MISVTPRSISPKKGLSISGTTKPIADEVPFERLRAVADGENLFSLIISNTRSFVLGLTAPELFITLETVALETPASSAITHNRQVTHTLSSRCTL